ncbi:MAG: MazG-like family protein [Candidatus Dojkabacteria bacterium]
MAKSIAELTRIICNFTEERGWTNNDPNQILSSIFIELGELAEHYQWQSEFTKLSASKKREIGYEFVDVIFYLFKLAERSGIDIEKYFDEKVPKLEKKFPVGIDTIGYNKVKREYRKKGQNKLYT